MLGFSKSERIGTLVRSVISASGDDIIMEPDVAEKYEALHKFLFANVYTNPIAKGEEAKVGGMISKLYDYFTKNADKLPREYIFVRENEGVERAAVDHIAGMTDRYAEYIFRDLFIPHSWQF